MPGEHRLHLVHAIDYETVREVPSQQRCGEQELDAVKATHEHATRRRHDVVLFGVLPHERTYVVARHRRVLEDRLHLGKVILQMFRDANVAFDHAEQRTVDNCCDDLLLGHLPFLTGWRVSFAFSVALPHFDHFHVTSEVGCVLFRVGQKRGHGLVVLRIRFLGVGVAFRATVPETSVELIGGVRLSTPSIDRKLPNSLFAAITLMTDCASRSVRLAREPLDGHLPIRLGLLRTELIFLPTTRIPPRGHVLHDGPQI